MMKPTMNTPVGGVEWWPVVLVLSVNVKINFVCTDPPKITMSLFIATAKHHANFLKNIYEVAGSSFKQWNLTRS